MSEHPGRRTAPRLTALAAAVLLAAGATAATASTSATSGGAPAAPPAALPAAGTATTGLSVAEALAVPGAQRLPSGGVAVPLRAAPPTWLTDDLLAASRRGPVPAPAAAAAALPDAPLSGYVGIRPGSEILFPYGCTTNFVFGTPGSYAIGTAGHCVDRTGQEVTLLTVAPGEPPSTANLVLVTIGAVTKKVDNGVGADFALISIKPELQSWVFPTIAGVGGPCGAYTGTGVVRSGVPVQGHATVGAGEQVFHYGHGLGVGTGGTPRTGHGLYWETDAFWWAGNVVFGDSGSAARVGTTGLGAAGDVTHLIVFDGKHLGATAAGTRITKIQKLVSKPLASSPYCV